MSARQWLNLAVRLVAFICAFLILCVVAYALPNMLNLTPLRILHFVLFVIACRAVHSYNRERRRRKLLSYPTDNGSEEHIFRGCLQPHLAVSIQSDVKATTASKEAGSEIYAF